MTTQPGTYALLLRADDTHSIDVGALGGMSVSPGTYVYLGSAFGFGGLRARVERHATGDGAMHWHVDYLRAVARLEAVWYTHDETKRECTWAAIVREMPGATLPVVGFGASDCDCPAHLVQFDAAPALSTFRSKVRSCCPDHEPVRCVEMEGRLER